MKTKQFAVCVRNDGYEVSLERRKSYQVLPDPEAAKHRQVRVIDESGDDYLYPQNFFAPIELPQPIRRAAEPSWLPSSPAAHPDARQAPRHVFSPVRPRAGGCERQAWHASAITADDKRHTSG